MWRIYNCPPRCKHPLQDICGPNRQPVDICGSSLGLFKLQENSFCSCNEHQNVGASSDVATGWDPQVLGLRWGTSHCQNASLQNIWIGSHGWTSYNRRHCFQTSSKWLLKKDNIIYNDKLIVLPIARWLYSVLHNLAVLVLFWTTFSFWELSSQSLLVLVFDTNEFS